MTSRYDAGVRSLREKVRNAPQRDRTDEECQISDKYIAEIDNFDWFNHTNSATKPFLPNPSIVAGVKISQRERQSRMLRGLMSTCGSCSMCELGLRSVSRNSSSRDPHLLSNMQPSKFMIVGLCPDWDDLTKRQPLSGPAGDIFDREIAKYNRSRDDFYICNLVRCWVDGKLQQEYVDSCASFLQMEVKLLKPKLIIALGQFVFQQLCSDDKFCDSVSKIRSGRYGKVFAAHYPSFENITEFKKQIGLVCRLLEATD